MQAVALQSLDTQGLLEHLVPASFVFAMIILGLCAAAQTHRMMQRLQSAEVQACMGY